MGFGRIYSIYDNKNKLFVYCGQTTNRRDKTPHGKIIISAWKNNRERYEYVIEEEFENISQNDLNDLEVKYIMEIRKTYNDINPCGLNFDSGGKSNGKLSGETLKRYSKASKKKWADKEYKERLIKQRKSLEYRKMISEKTKKGMTKEVKEKIKKKRDKIFKSKEYRERLSKSILAAMNRPEVKEKFKGKNNYKYSGDYIVPDDKNKLYFSSVSDASKFTGFTRQLIYKYCRTHNDKKFCKNFDPVLKYLNIKSMIGLSPYDLGFEFVKLNNKEKLDNEQIVRPKRR